MLLNLKESQHGLLRALLPL